MRVAIVNSGAPGTAALLAPFFDALVRSGAELLVVEQAPAGKRETGRDQHGATATRASSYRLELVPTYLYNRRHAPANIMGPRYQGLLLHNRPSVVYVMGEPGYLSTFQTVRFVRRHLPGAKICLFAAQNVYQRFPPPFPWIERWVLARLDHAFPIGRDHENVLRMKGYRGDATHLPLGVDTQVFRPGCASGAAREIELPSPVVGYVGELLPARDIPLLIAAVGLCATRVSLLVVGDGASRPKLKYLAATIGLGDRTLFVGRVAHPDVPRYMNCMDILVLPSRAVRNRCFGVFRIANAEQFGRVLIEAMACGKPVVGSSCGEIPKVIGDAGRVFAEGDASALARVLDELASDPLLRQRLGRLGRERAVALYDWRVIAEKMLSVMLETLGTSNRNQRPVSSGTCT